jgi:hypothetical protein
MPGVRRQSHVIVIRGALYFVLVFGVGFVLGVLRVLVVEPRVGQRYAELLETPLMLAAMYFAARFVTQRFRASRTVEHLYSGLVALILLVSVEFSVVLGLRGLSIREYLSERDPVAGAVYGVMLILFAVMPWLVSRRFAAGQ